MVKAVDLRACWNVRPNPSSTVRSFKPKAPRMKKQILILSCFGFPFTCKLRQCEVLWILQRVFGCSASLNILNPARAVCMLMLLLACGAAWFLEQPSSSLLPRHCRFQWMIKNLEELGIRVFWNCWQYKQFILDMVVMYFNCNCSLEIFYCDIRIFLLFLISQ